MGRNTLASGLVIVSTLFGTAYAGPITNPSFEQAGLSGWQAAGDVSVQTASIGSAPMDGNFQALIATLPGTSTISGQMAVHGTTDFFQTVGYPKYFGAPQSSPPPNYPTLTWPAYSFLRQDITLQAGDQLSFDYNFLTQEVAYVDYAFLFVQSLDQPNPYQYIDGDTRYAQPLPGPNSYQWLSMLTPALCGGPNYCDFGPPYSDMPLQSSGVDLCLGGGNCPTTSETGWRSASWSALAQGNYAIYIGVHQQVDDLVASALLVDNFRIQSVPEPAVLILFALGLLGLGASRHRRSVS